MTMRRTKSAILATLIAVSMGAMGDQSIIVSTLHGATPQRVVRVLQDLQYYTGPGADPILHSFDLYLPEGKTNVPMLFFIHGGGWRGGDKVYDGLDKIVKICVDLGVGVISANYRVSPAIKHPVHIQDVARAFAWLHENSAQYGADQNRIFVAGGSAGAHLAALLALDGRYLQKHGLSPKAIAGVMLFSGIYDLANFPEPGVVPTRKEQAFGTDAELLRSASPTAYVGKLGPDTPPFFIAYTDNDLFGLGEQAKTLYSLFLRNRLPAELLEQPGRTHQTKTSGIGTRLNGADDVLGPAIERFLISVMNGTFAETAEAVWPAEGTANPPMQVLRDIQYYKGTGSDPKFHALDLFLPEGEANFPLVFYVHGGGWRAGDKGTPTALVNIFGRLGMGVASVNYRLSAQVKHPTHIQDVARAFSWVYENASRYKIDSDRIVILGVAAGGHLVALLGLNTEYLSQQGVPPNAIKGVVSISGIYDLAGWPEPGKVPTRREQAFGTEPAVLRQASPITYIKPNAPPILITFTDWDLFMLREEALQLYNLLLRQGAPGELVQVPGRNHFDQFGGMGKRVPFVQEDDVLGLAVTRFVVDLVKASDTGTTMTKRGTQP